MDSDFGRSRRTAWNLAPGLRQALGVLACVVVTGGMPAVVAAADNAPQGNAAAAPASPSDAAPAPASKTKSAGKSSSDRDRRVRLNFKAASWSRVIKRVAKHGGLTVVMKKSPPGSFTRSDLNLYTVAEAIWVLNRDLEPAGYRLVRQGNFLMLLDMDALRSDYRPSVARRLPRDDAPKVRPVSGQQSTAGGSAVEPALLSSVAPETVHESAESAKEREAANAADEKEEDAIATRKIRLAFFSTPWTRVLPKVAQESGLTLVMKRCPSGALNHPDFRKFTVPEAIAFLNHELDDTNFRLIRQDKFLIVLYTEDLRAEYDRPVVRALDELRNRVRTGRPTFRRRPPPGRTRTFARCRE